MPRPSSRWTDLHVRRLFWRAGFGATEKEAKHYAKRGKQATLSWILNGGRGPSMVGPAPTVDGHTLDPTNGTLFYYNPSRVEIKTEEAALRLIRQAKEDASKGGVVKDVFFLILYPRKLTGFPTGEQIQQIRSWFKDVPYGFDIP